MCASDAVMPRLSADSLDAFGVQGMTYLHSFRPAVLHRDLKSPNLLVDTFWRVKARSALWSHRCPEQVIRLAVSRRGLQPSTISVLNRYDKNA